MENVESTKKWSAALRVNHWIMFISITILIATGFYIGRPFGISGGDTMDKFLMGEIRFLHILFGIILSITFLWRLYLAFFSRFHADWRDFLAFLDLENLVKQIKYYALISNEKPEEKYVYAPLQSLAYLGLIVMVLLIVVTGLILTGSGYGKGLISFFYIFVKPFQNMLGLATVRFIHHILMWLFILYALVHVYMAFWTDAVKKDGTISSMINGLMFEKKK